ncbi:2-hydroxyacid dehydrogenase [Loktanella sp. 3ANDIMAR09]|uniref:2-hydroxyacid dehydrogenase n=1 Tax=Loktanella sp. 3ANDIMAR09 TaxID=1225657 RepID=UPI0006F7973D|nr:D-glycerate dehydrogenase [Loktanella sp. 3ANDIMAR09]KQI68112.1 2-hydroxyacid dehydrogenase [Loktanella sp. 3ANDIMAR09]
MKRLLLTRPFPDATIEAVRPHFDVTISDDGPLSVEAAASALQEYDAIMCTLGDGFTDMAFATPDLRCKMLANFGVGYNHIDVRAAKAAGVTVSNTPGAVTDATADIALTLMLMAARRAGEGERLVRAGQWTGWEPTQLLGMHLTGKRIGIVGMGRIGQAIARRAHFGFDMKVIYYNRSVKDVDFPARQVEELSGVMSQSDVVVVAVPGGGENVHLIDADALAELSDGAIFINIARGDVVDEASLVAALKSGRISAGLDVYENEPTVPSELLGLDNVVLLPHLGTAALEVREAMGQLAVDNLIAWDQGDSPPNVV